MSADSLREHFKAQEECHYRYIIYDNPGDAKPLIEMEDCEVAIRISVALGKPVLEESFNGFGLSIGKICDGHPPWRWVGTVFFNAELFPECDPTQVTRAYVKNWKMSDPKPTLLPCDFVS